jgi:hypothetical protein
MVCRCFRILKRGKQQTKCEQIKGGLTDEEIEELKKKLRL